MKNRRRTGLLETISVTVTEASAPIYSEALACVCTTVGLFEADPSQVYWRVEGVKERGADEKALQAALAVAALLSREEAQLLREETQAEGWLSRTYEAFPPQEVGRRFVIRGTHLPRTHTSTRHVLTLDAGTAFGSGEHGSTRGCLRALEAIAYRKPQRILDMGCGSGVLALATAKLLNRPVLGIDIDPWSIRATVNNARLNHLGNRIRGYHGNGWLTRQAQAFGPYDLIFANILARPLCKMARPLAANLAPSGTAILAGLLTTQIPMVLSAHRRQGLVLEKTYREGEWATLVLRRRF